jgi:hypothetical protein
MFPRKWRSFRLPAIPRLYDILRQGGCEPVHMLWHSNKTSQSWSAETALRVLFYSTDYAELIGCCDRVVILYEGRIVRELAGEALTEQKICSTRLTAAPDRRAHVTPL